MELDEECLRVHQVGQMEEVQLEVLDVEVCKKV